MNFINNMLYGFLGKLFFLVLVALAFWFEVRQRNLKRAASCLLLAALIACGGGLISMFNKFFG